MAEFLISTVESVERKYLVMADNEDQAKARLHLHFRDSAVLRDGLVTAQAKEEVKSRRITASKTGAGPKAPTSA